jgi:radical SAM protein with 4Fe4S-binding SPASM domain
LDAGSPAEEELSTGEASRLISSVAELGAKSLVFTGGEPLLRKDLLKLIQHTHHLGIHPVLATNGTLLTNAALKILKRVGAGIAFNLPALDETIYSTFTGVNSKNKDTVLETIQECLGDGLQCTLGVAVTNLNLGEVIKIVELAHRLGAYCDVSMTIPVGRASFALLPNPFEYEALLRRLAREWAAIPMSEIDSSPHTHVSVYEPIYVRTSIEEGISIPKRCLCSIGETLHVMEDGSVHPCAFADVSLGNVRESSLSAIWENTVNSQWLRKLRNPQELGGACGTCPYRHVCIGCRVRAKVATGSWFSSDPMCTLI